MIPNEKKEVREIINKYFTLIYQEESLLQLSNIIVVLQMNVDYIIFLHQLLVIKKILKSFEALHQAQR